MITLMYDGEVLHVTWAGKKETWSAEELEKSSREWEPALTHLKEKYAQEGKPVACQCRIDVFNEHA